MRESEELRVSDEVKAASAWPDMIEGPGDSEIERRACRRAAAITAALGVVIAITVLGLLAAREPPPAKDQSRLGAATTVAPPLPRLRPGLAPGGGTVTTGRAAEADAAPGPANGTGAHAP